jgi:exodeoxyribonuclease V gamma subunit
LFNLFKSNKMENLMAAFAGVIRENPGDPLEHEWVSVQSRGMKQWISAQLALQHKICANINFVFPGQVVDLILDHTLPLSGKEDGVDSPYLFWSVLGLLTSGDSSLFSPLVRAYTHNDDTGIKTYQLAKRVAGLFDDYLAYRPDMLLEWQNRTGTKGPADPHALWQSQMWNLVTGDRKQDHSAWRIHRFLTQNGKMPSADGGLPGRISFFGISALPPLFLELFNRISSIVDINLFLLAPSDGYFMDLKSERERLASGTKSPPPVDLHLFDEQTNPLLASLGTAGRDFFSQIETYDYHEPLPDLFEDPTANGSTMLAQLQSDILALVERKQGNRQAPVVVQPDDRSVSIHSCHSPMREAQVLKDLLLDTFEKDPGLSCHDIVVMMPDIEAYAPYIESVFSLEQSLPFAVSDRKKRCESPLIEAFLMILSLKGSRLEKKEVMDLISQPAVMEKFRLDAEDVLQVERFVEQANILWGRNASHRKDLGLPGYDENTWEFGLKRLFMGMAMPTHHRMPVKGVMPCPVAEGEPLEILGKLAQFCHRLFRGIERLNRDRTVAQWCRILLEWARNLLFDDNRVSEDMVFLCRTLDDIRQEAAEAGFDHPISFETMAAVIEQHLDLSVSQGSFWSGKITFCNIMPMRSIPYKIVVMMGMDEASFPRQVFGAGFDLMKKYPQRGDKNERLEDRYLFLETLLSARQQVIITYTGQDIQDNTPIPCSGPVSELMDVMADSFAFPDGYAFHIQHRLHPFDPAYFKPDSPLFSYSSDNCRIATSLCRPFVPPRPFFDAAAGRGGKEPEPQVGMEDVIRFFYNPCAWTLKERMNLVFARDPEEVKVREPFALSGLDRYALGTRLLEEEQQGDAEQRFVVHEAEGVLPYGRRGRQVFDQVQGLAAPIAELSHPYLSTDVLEPVSAGFRVSKVRLSVFFNDLRPDGLTRVFFGRINGRRLLSAWIQHLCLNIAAAPSCPKKSRLIGQDPSGKTQAAMVEFPVLDDTALSLLEPLINMFLKGMEIPVCFFAETAYQFALAMKARQYELNESTMGMAMLKARRFWHGDAFMPGEKADRYAALCFQDNDPFHTIDTLQSSGFVKNALTVFRPLIDSMKVVA